jgi:hypothetical protein
LDEERIKRAVRSSEAAYEMWMAPMGIGTIPGKMAGGHQTRDRSTRCRLSDQVAANAI